MLENAYFLAKIGADTAENERNFEKNCPKLETTLPPDLLPGSNNSLCTARSICMWMFKSAVPPVERLPLPGISLEKLAINIILQIFGKLVLGCVETATRSATRT